MCVRVSVCVRARVNMLDWILIVNFDDVSTDTVDTHQTFYSLILR